MPDENKPIENAPQSPPAQTPNAASETPAAVAVEQPAASPPEPKPRKPRPTFRQILSGLWNLVVRFYALALLLAVLVPGLMAVRYLLRTVFVPNAVPKRLLEWQARIDVDALRSRNVPGVTGPAARAPIGHYHRVERWFQPDEQNGCTTAGCHQPLPHTQKMKVPAFANFHTTFLTCQSCHADAQKSGELGWVRTSDASVQNAPALLQLANYLETSAKERQDDPAAAHKTITRLLSDSITAAGKDDALSDLLLQFETTQPGSPVWRRAEQRLIAEVPLHARGEYAAKLTRGAQTYARDSKEIRKLAKAYQNSAPGTGERVQLHKQVHQALVRPPAMCVSCHSEKGLDFQKLGYSPSRSDLLKRLELARLMQNIRDGGHFEIPRLPGEEDE